MHTKEDLQNVLPMANEALLAAYAAGEQADHFVFHLSSGTSGGIPLLRVAHHPGGVLPRFRNARRTAVFAGSRMIRLNNAFYFLRTDTPPEASLLLLDFADLDSRAAELLRDFDPDYLIGSPSFLAHLFRLPLDPSVLPSVSRITLMGERSSKNFSDFLKSCFPDALLENSYALAEIGGVGISCRYLPFGQFHPVRNVSITVADPDAEGVGELVVSKKGEHSDVREYRTGDCGRSLPAHCVCGSPAFEVFGRIGYDYVKIAGAQLRTEEFERVASELDLYFSDFRAEARMVKVGKGERASLRLIVAPRGSLLQDPEIQALVAGEFARRLFVTPSKTLENLVAEGIFLPLRLKLAHTPFPAENKAVKLRFIHD